MKSNGIYSEMMEQKPNQNSPGNHVTNRPRPAGPLGYERGSFEQMNYRSILGNNVVNKPRPPGLSGYGAFIEEPNYFNGYHNTRGMLGGQGCASPTIELQGNRQNFRAQYRYPPQDQYENLRNGMSALIVEGGGRTRPNATLSPRMPNSGQSSNVRHQHLPNIGPLPSPPSNWINKPTAGTASGYEKQVKKVYQVKTRPTQNSSEGSINDIA